MHHYHTEEQWINWVDLLADGKYLVIDDFLPSTIFRESIDFLLQKLELEAFRLAGLGAGLLNQHDQKIRGDYVYWLDQQRDEPAIHIFDTLTEVKDQLNRLCFLSLSGFEFHLAHYPIHSFYRKHIDQIHGRSNRLISMIVYLNQSWTLGNGGELRMYVDDHIRDIAPLSNRCVLFRSADIPHEVLATNVSRYSLTGWFMCEPDIPGLRNGIGWS